MCLVLLRWAWSELSTDEVSASSKVSLYLISPSAVLDIFPKNIKADQFETRA